MTTTEDTIRPTLRANGRTYCWCCVWFDGHRLVCVNRAPHECPVNHDHSESRRGTAR